jgi:hypothetical protein
MAKTSQEIRRELETAVRTDLSARGWEGLSTRELLVLATRDRSQPGTEYSTELEEVAHIVFKKTRGRPGDIRVFTTGWLCLKHLHFLAALEIARCPVCWTEAWKNPLCSECREARGGLEP